MDADGQRLRLSVERQTQDVRVLRPGRLPLRRARAVALRTVRPAAPVRHQSVAVLFLFVFFLRSLFDRNRFPRPVGRLVSTGPVLQRHWLSATNENASTEVSLRLRDRVDAPPLPGPHQRTKRVPPSLTRPCLRLVRAVEASSCRITSSLNDANLIGSQPPIGRCQAGTNPWAPNEERTATASRDRRRPVKRNEKERKRAGVGRSFRASYTPVLFFLRSLPDRGNRYASPFFFFFASPRSLRAAAQDGEPIDNCASTGFHLKGVARHWKPMTDDLFSFSLVVSQQKKHKSTQRAQRSGCHPLIGSPFSENAGRAELVCLFFFRPDR